MPQYLVPGYGLVDGDGDVYQRQLPGGPLVDTYPFQRRGATPRESRLLGTSDGAPASVVPVPFLDRLRVARDGQGGGHASPRLLFAWDGYNAYYGDGSPAVAAGGRLVRANVGSWAGVGGDNANAIEYVLLIPSGETLTFSGFYRASSTDGAFGSSFFGVGNTSTRTGYACTVDQNGNFQAHISDTNATDFVNTSGTYSQHALRHFVLTSRGSTDRELYLDGGSVANGTISRTVGNTNRVGIGGVRIGNGPSINYNRSTAFCRAAPLFIFRGGVTDAQAALLYERQRADPFGWFRRRAQTVWAPA